MLGCDPIRLSQYSVGGHVDTLKRRRHLIGVNGEYRNSDISYSRLEMAAPFDCIDFPTDRISGYAHPIIDWASWARLARLDKIGQTS